MGIGEDEKLDDALQVTIVATGFNSSNPIGIIKPAEQKRVIHELNDEIEENLSNSSKHVSINSEVESNQFDLFHWRNLRNSREIRKRKCVNTCEFSHRKNLINTLKMNELACRSFSFSSEISLLMKQITCMLCKTNLKSLVTRRY